MNRNKILLLLAVPVLAAVIYFFVKGPNYTVDELNYIKQIENQRGEKDTYMRDNPASPFNKKGKVEFHPLKYFEVNPKFVFQSRLYEYQVKDSITTQGTKGDIRKGVRWGYVSVKFEGKEFKVNVYRIIGINDGAVYYTIWFTDQTTNKSTYGVGRYLDFEKSDDPDHIYQIDFNLAYNPYCAYSPNYSCTVPLKEDFIDYAIKAGEKIFHD